MYSGLGQTVTELTNDCSLALPNVGISVELSVKIGEEEMKFLTREDECRGC